MNNRGMLRKDKINLLLWALFVVIFLLVLIFINVNDFSENFIDEPSKCYTHLQPSRYFNLNFPSPVVENSMGGGINIETFNNQKIMYTQVTDTGSMRPTIADNSLILIVVPKSTDDIKIGDVVLAWNNSVYITHRVINILNSTYITKGDNNAVADKRIWNFTDIKFKVVGVLY
jgi:hypothetical protein